MSATVPVVVATIVTFHPDGPAVLDAVATLRADVAALVLFANSALDVGFEDELRARAAPARLVVIDPGENVGLGAAYNAAAEVASQCEARYLLLLDQDSIPGETMVPKLAAVAAALEGAGERPALIGPLPVAESGAPFKIPRLAPARGALPAVRVEFAISSGSLVAVEAIQDVGGFRADFFIDAIDIEWCLRATHRGWSVWIAEAVPMVHSLGRGVIALPLGLRLTDQPPQRLYTYLRNQLAMVRLPHVPLRRKLKFAVQLPFKCLVYLGRSGFSGPVARAVYAGLAHGAMRDLRPPLPVWDWIASGQRGARRSNDEARR
jgi:rhamnosyltransferase